MADGLSAFCTGMDLYFWIQLTSRHHDADVRSLVSCPGHEETRAPDARAVEDNQVGGGADYVGVAHLPEMCLQFPVAFDKEHDWWGGVEVLEHLLRLSAEATNDDMVTNSLVDLLHVTRHPLWSAGQDLNKCIATHLGKPGS